MTINAINPKINPYFSFAAREELRAEEFTKFQAALMWSKKYCDSNPVCH